MENNIYRDGVLVDVNVSFWSGAKALNPEDMGLEKKDVADVYKLGQKHLLPTEVIHGFRLVEGRARRVVEESSFPFPIGNARFIPRKKFSKVLQELKGYQDEYNKLVDNLIDKYDEYRAQMVPVYRQAAETAFLAQTPAGVQEFSLEGREQAQSEFVDRFLARVAGLYPTAESLRSRFSLDWDVYEIATPRMRKGDSETIADSEDKAQAASADYREQMHRKLGGFIEDVVASLRKETLEICTRIAMNIKDGKVVKDRTIDSLKGFIDKFSELNFVGDQKVEGQLEALRKEFLNAHTAEDISDQPDLQEELRRRLSMVADAASDVTDINSVTGEYKRKIEWQESI